MPILSKPDEILSADDYFLIALKTSQTDQRHCGIIYRLDSNTVKILHLAFHYDLRNHDYLGDYHWTATDLSTENQKFLAAYSLLVSAVAPQIPYGFDANGVIFDAVTGEIAPIPPGKGLTCSTFVLALLRTYGFLPVDADTWPERTEDEVWKEKIIGWMRQKGASDDHIAAVVANKRSIRVRPEEVTGAMSENSSLWSVEFARAIELAVQVLDELAA